MSTTISRRLMTGIVLYLLLVFPILAHADVVLDGGFETPSIGGADVELGLYYAFGPWTVTQGTPWVFPNATIAAYEGEQSVDLVGCGETGAFSQTLATTPGQSYNLSFALAGDFRDSTDAKYLNVYWGDSPFDPGTSVATSNYTVNEAAGWSAADPQWATVTISGLSATSSSTYLTFQGASTWQGPEVDGITTGPEGPENSAVPEPGSLALLGLGLPMAGLWLRRKRTA